MISNFGKCGKCGKWQEWVVLGLIWVSTTTLLIQAWFIYKEWLA